MSVIPIAQPRRPHRTTQIVDIRTLRGVVKKRKTGGCTIGGASALKTLEHVQALKNYFLTSNNEHSLRDYALVTFALNSGRRGGDILKICIGDIMNEDCTIKTSFYIKEQKTNKTALVHVNDTMRDAISTYLDKRMRYGALLAQDPLFASRQHGEDGRLKPLSLRRWNDLLKEAQAVLHLPGKISSHTCRKTMGRIMFDQGKNDPAILAKLQKMYNHSSSATTLIYIDHTEDELHQLHQEIQL